MRNSAYNHACPCTVTLSHNNNQPLTTVAIQSRTVPPPTARGGREGGARARGGRAGARRACGGRASGKHTYPKTMLV